MQPKEPASTPARSHSASAPFDQDQGHPPPQFPDSPTMALIPASIRSAEGKGKSRVFLRRAAVCKRTGLPSSTLYRYITLGLFPRAYRLGPNAVAWRLCDVEIWCASRPQVVGRDHG